VADAGSSDEEDLEPVHRHSQPEHLTETFWTEEMQSWTTKSARNTRKWSSKETNDIAGSNTDQPILSPPGQGMARETNWIMDDNKSIASRAPIDFCPGSLLASKELPPNSGQLRSWASYLSSNSDEDIPRHSCHARPERHVGVEFYTNALGVRCLPKNEHWLNSNGNDLSGDEVEVGDESWKISNGGLSGCKLVWCLEGVLVDDGGYLLTA
jgi:hypothetical protein